MNQTIPFFFTDFGECFTEFPVRSPCGQYGIRFVFGGQERYVFVPAIDECQQYTEHMSHPTRTLFDS